MNPKYKEDWAFWDKFPKGGPTPKQVANTNGAMNLKQLRHFVDCVVAWHTQEAVDHGVDDVARIEALYEITFDVDALQKAAKAK